MYEHLSSLYTIRFSDCDPFRHLNNARYIDYFLNAREDHLRDHYQLDLASIYKKGMGWVVMQHDITYLRPASFNEKVCILSGLLEVGTEHLLVEMLMLDENKSQLKAILHTKFISVNLGTGKRQPHDAAFQEFLSSKELQGINKETISVKERIEYWQNTIKPVQKSAIN